MAPSKEISHTVAFDRLDSGKPFHALVAADSQQLPLLAKRLKLLSMSGFQGTVDVHYDKKMHIYTLSGAIEATFEQECAVTLEPIEQKLDFDFSEKLIRPDFYNEADYADTDLDDEPEIYEEDELDLAEIMVQQLALNIPEFPRKADAQLDPRYGITEEELKKQAHDKNPFAVLEKLKKNDN